MAKEPAKEPVKERVLGDVAAEWQVNLPDGIHHVEIEHGTTSGKRVIRVDEKEVFRKNWMFSLVGSENFKVSKMAAKITIESSGLTFYYTLSIGGQTLKKFIETQSKQTRTWLPTLAGEGHRVVLDVKTLDVYVDGEKTDTVGEFVDQGAENHFTIGSYPAYIKTVPSGHKRKGLLYKLIVNNEQEMDPVTEVVAD